MEKPKSPTFQRSVNKQEQGAELQSLVNCSERACTAKAGWQEMGLSKGN